MKLLLEIFNSFCDGFIYRWNRSKRIPYNRLDLIFGAIYSLFTISILLPFRIAHCRFESQFNCQGYKKTSIGNRFSVMRVLVYDLRNQSDFFTQFSAFETSDILFLCIIVDSLIYFKKRREKNGKRKEEERKRREGEKETRKQEDGSAVPIHSHKSNISHCGLRIALREPYSVDSIS